MSVKVRHKLVIIPERMLEIGGLEAVWGKSTIRLDTLEFFGKLCCLGRVEEKILHEYLQLFIKLNVDYPSRFLMKSVTMVG